MQSVVISATPNIAVQRACRLLGTQRMLAHRLKVSPTTVSNWVTGKAQVPKHRCIAIEQATGKMVTREQLRMDLAWHLLNDTDG